MPVEPGQVGGQCTRQQQKGEACHQGFPQQKTFPLILFSNSPWMHLSAFARTRITPVLSRLHCPISSPILGLTILTPCEVFLPPWNIGQGRRVLRTDS